NVSSSTIESAGLFVGPALGGLLLAVTDAGVVFAFTAGTLLWSALMVSLIRADVRADEAREAEFAEAASIADEALAGFRAIAGVRRARQPPDRHGGPRERDRAGGRGRPRRPWRAPGHRGRPARPDAHRLARPRRDRRRRRDPGAGGLGAPGDLHLHTASGGDR